VGGGGVGGWAISGQVVPIRGMLIMKFCLCAAGWDETAPGGGASCKGQLFKLSHFKYLF
jgi:hypothetical protein